MIDYRGTLISSLNWKYMAEIRNVYCWRERGFALYIMSLAALGLWCWDVSVGFTGLLHRCI